MSLALVLAGLLRQEPLPPGDLRLIQLARSAVVAEVLHRPLPQPQTGSATLPVFVTIEIHGAVRGCRGGLETRTPTLENEVILEARSASQHDPRYKPLQVADLASFKVTVTLVDRVEPIDSVEGLTPEQGLVLKSGDRTGVVLPLEGRDATTRLHWAFRKAGVPEGTPVQLFRLSARRFRG
jgi:MEMO1 family protein